MNFVKGSCHCGSVKFEIQLPTNFCSHCHCEDCRRTHGAAFVTWTSVPLERFKFLEGEALLKKYESDPGVRWGFCGECGTSLVYDCDEALDTMYVTVACLEGEIDKKPDSHVSFEEHVSWFDLKSSLPCYRAKTQELI